MDLSGDTGSSILEIAVKNDDNYAVRLNYFFDAEDPSDRKKVWKAAGGDLRIKPGVWKESGAPFDIETIIVDLKTGLEVHRSSIKNPKLTSYETDSLHAELCRVLLKKGDYKVNVRRFGSTESLTETRVTITIVEAYYGK